MKRKKKGEIGELDDCGNLWFNNPVVLCEISTEEFKNLCRGFPLVLVERETDRLIAAVKDKASIKEILTEEKKKPEDFLFSSGPISAKMAKRLERPMADPVPQ